MQLTLTPEAQANLAGVLDCCKSVLLAGPNPYVAQEKERLAIRFVDLLIESNADATGLTAMLAEVEAQKADVDGQFAAQREHLAIESDLHNSRNKAHLAILTSTLAAIRLDQQAAQVKEFTA